MGLVLAIDQGTSNSKALLLNDSGEVVARASAPVGVVYPRPGWVEQSAHDIWHSVVAVSRECIARAEGASIVALGISNQRESVLLWNRVTGDPIGPSVTWQCRRSADRLNSLRTPEFEAEVRTVTGLGLDPLFPAAKIGWLLDAHPEARALASDGNLCIGTIDSWLVFKLTGGRTHATDHGNASRTQLFDIAKGAWSPTLAATFEVPIEALPAPLPSNGAFGVTDGGSGLPAGIPIRAVMGDSHAALFGHGVRGPGVVKATYGTGSSLMTLTHAPTLSSHGLSTTIAWRMDEVSFYALEGNISVSAQAAAWAAGLLGFSSVAELTECAATVADSGGVYFVPALVGLGAPYWRDNAKALFWGMSLGTTPAHVARATLEAIALQVRDVFSAMEADMGQRLAGLSVDGGPTSNRLLMQIQADLLDRPISRPVHPELSAIGVAIMAGAAVGLWGYGGPERTRRVLDTLDPAIPDDVRLRVLAGWRTAVALAMADHATSISGAADVD